MNSQYMKSLSIGASLLITLVSGAPAIADDTELLLIDPSASAATPPNIMFILDTSGSMGDPVDTTDPFDSTRIYPIPVTDGCDPDRLYWTTLGVEPICTANNQYIEDAAFKCAGAVNRLMGMGSYAGVMVQHRDDGSGTNRWQEIEIGNDTDLVECQKDDGVHGDGTAGEVYAQSGSSSSPFTSNVSAGLAWGSGDATQPYTVFDGNFLNWKADPVTVNKPKLDILKAVTTNLMNSIENVNVGLMRLTGSDGGRVIHAISNVDTDRAAILAKINGLVDGGATPIAETLYESALYWRGLTPQYGDLGAGAPADIDTAAFVGGVAGQYRAPTMPVCTRNFNVLLTDGAPVDDDGAQALAPGLPRWGTPGAGLAATCSGAGDGRCLDDISAYLHREDISAGTIGDQTVTTHTIGFDINLDILRDTATASEGTYYLADDAATLTTALMNIIISSVDVGLSFAAPSVAVNTFNRTQNMNDVYLSTFLPASRVHWAGNLKKYTIGAGFLVDADGDPAVVAATGLFDLGARSIWTPIGTDDGPDVEIGGAANRLPDPLTRNVYTNNGSNNRLTDGSNDMTPANFSLADFGLTGAGSEPTIAEVLDWAHGVDVLNDDGDTSTTVRNDMGDPLHSQPAVVVYGGSAGSPDVVVFTATNDGYLHAVDGDTGVELWSFVPKQFLPDLPQLMLNGNATYKHYAIDGDVVPVVFDDNEDGIIDPADDFIYLIFGMRRGGNDYFALDVTRKNSPELLWHKTYPEFGQSWSRPVVGRVDMVHTGLNTKKAVVILAEGYDTTHDSPPFPAAADSVGAGISMLDLVSGEQLWRAGSSNADLTLSLAGRAMNRAFPSQVRAVDLSGDGFIDRMYAIDVGGQLFRFDLFRNRAPATLVTGGVIAQFGGEGTASAGDLGTRRFYAPPDVSIFTDPVLNRRFLAIGVGSGYRAHPLNIQATDVYYSLRDKDLFAKLEQPAYNVYDIATDADMHEVSGQVNTVIGTSERGWKFTLPADQMILSSSATFDNSVFFVAFIPDLIAATSCEAAPGNNVLYQVNVANGDPVANNLDTMDPLDSDPARVTNLLQGGIAPSPAFLFPAADATCYDESCMPPPLGCVGVECFDPGFENNPVRTLWTQDGIE